MLLVNLDRFRPPREGGGGGGGGDDCNNDQRKYAILLFRCAVDPQIAGFWSCQSFANLLPYAIYIAILREQLTNLPYQYLRRFKSILFVDP